MKKNWFFIVTFIVLIILGFVLVFHSSIELGADWIKATEIMLLTVGNLLFITAIVIELVLMCHGQGYQLSVMLVTFVLAGLFSSFCCRMMLFAFFSPVVTVIAPCDELLKWCMSIFTFTGPLALITAIPVAELNNRNGWTDTW